MLSSACKIGFVLIWDQALIKKRQVTLSATFREIPIDNKMSTNSSLGFHMMKICVLTIV